MNKIKCAIFGKERLLEVLELKVLPSKGHYIQVSDTEFTGLEIESVIFLLPNDEEWDVVLVVGITTCDVINEPSRETIERVISNSAKERVRAKQYIERRLREYQNPNEVWQRRRAIWERLRNGESSAVLAEELHIGRGRVAKLAHAWADLIEFVLRHGGKVDEGSDVS